MPIRIPDQLPAVKTLNDENIFVMTEQRATTQDIRPLEILLLNLMPTKIATETQMARLLGNTPLQVNLELMHTSTHTSKNTSQEHMLTFYKSFDQLRHRRFDGMIVTGAPVEQMPFEDVAYWPELCEIMDWSLKHVYSTLHICWGAQAGLYHHYGIQKYPLEKKISGVFEHTLDYQRSILFRGFDDVFHIPHSRYTTIKREDVEARPELRVLASSEKAGVYAVSTHGGRQIFVTGHVEYDTLTLDAEYRRDKVAGFNPEIPENYYPGGDPSGAPLNTWRSAANLFFCNWLNYFVYQDTPYDLLQIDALKEV